MLADSMSYFLHLCISKHKTSLLASDPLHKANRSATVVAGALAGAALIGEVPLQLMAKNVLDVAHLASSNSLGAFSPSFSLANIMWDGLEHLLPDDIHIRATDKLYVSMTKISDRSNLLVHKFSSKHELLEALRASSFVPFVSGWRPPRFRGDLVFDGGYSDNLPIFDPFTITVSPFAGDASICPPDESQIGSLLNLRIPHGPTNSNNSFSLSKENSMKLINAVVPPGVEGMEQLCSQGFQDAMRFLTMGNHIKCEGCREGKKSEECSMCKIIIEEAATKTLPMEITEVFEEAASREGRPGAGSLMLSLFTSVVSGPIRFGVVASCRVVHLQVKIAVGLPQVGYKAVDFSAKSMVSLALTAFNAVATITWSTPSIETCPFGSPVPQTLN